MAADVEAVVTLSPDGDPASEPPGGESSSDAPESMLAIVRTARQLTAAGDPHEVLRRAAEAACNLLGYSACAAALRGDDGQYRFEAAAGLSAQMEQQLRARTMSARAFRLLAGAATRIGGVLRIPAGHPVRSEPEVQAATVGTAVTVEGGSWKRGSLLIVPVLDEAGTVIGFLSPDDPKSGNLPNDAEALLLGGLAEVTAVALQSVTSREVARQALAVAEAQRRQLEDLLTASVAVRGHGGLDEVLREIVQAMTTAAGFTRAAVYLIDKETDQLWVRASVGLDADEDLRLRSTPVPLQEFAALMRPEMQVSRSYLFDHRFHQLPPELDQKLSALDPDPGWVDGMWHSMDTLTVPMEDAGGSLLGVISLDEPTSGRLPSVPHIRAVEMFGDQCSIAVAESRRYEQAVAEASTDALTGLANRRTLFARAATVMADMERRKQPCAVVFFDIDHFKSVNDRFGHAAGDEVIAAVARTMSERLRASDIIGRYGGEEFVAVLPGTGQEDALRIVEDLRNRISAIDVPSVRGARIRMSAGITLARPGEQISDAFARADTALYRAKQAGRDRSQVAAA